MLAYKTDKPLASLNVKLKTIEEGKKRSVNLIIFFTKEY